MIGEIVGTVSVATLADVDDTLQPLAIFCLILILFFGEQKLPRVGIPRVMLLVP